MSSIFNETIFESDKISQLRDQFSQNLPFPNICIDNFLNNDTADQLFNNFPPIDAMRKQYKGLNENKAEDTALVDTSPVFHELNMQLQSSEFIHFVEQVTGFKNLVRPNDKKGYGLHQGGDGSFLDVHIDFNIHPVLNLHRRLNLIIFLNKDWKEEWAGELEFWNKDVSECIQKYLPLHNRCVIFETNEISFHGYSKIKVPEGVTRKSFYSYYYTAIESEVKYHDTVFRTRPTELWTKKIATTAKDFIKNSIKQTIKKLGLSVYFKKIE